MDEIPPYYSSFNRTKLFQSTGILPGDYRTIDKFINSYLSTESTHTIQDSVLQREIDLAEAWYWRARMQTVIDLKEENKENTEELENRRVPHALKKMVRDSDMVLELATKRGVELGLLENSNKFIEDFAVVVEPTDADDSAIDETMFVKYKSLDGREHNSLMDIAEARMMALAYATKKLGSWDESKMIKIGSINPLNVLWSP
ncbi:hypothetical protein AX774_g5267 [Zancudomyces culisetae]|uniref:Uncharacterized protein n=1 Tax=Zancudomyces culisetae TaxID=1213189 RepID=A0A1R1PK14_ZANCU|nr:hypothetical protein AX774_g5267 [Zancudomyces culisetae]|eukprot:OMH81279.1 hypothetical protein AX774_g5267 [Zancudomyces culisetae]